MIESVRSIQVVTYKFEAEIVCYTQNWPKVKNKKQAFETAIQAKQLAELRYYTKKYATVGPAENQWNSVSVGCFHFWVSFKV